MKDFKSQIAYHRDTLNGLHQRIRTTFKLRDRSEQHKRAWSDACDEFHSFQTEVDDFLSIANANTIEDDKHLRKFIFDFLSVDPIYFRSGYEKERILKYIKSLDFTDHEMNVLRQIILGRIHNGALREFRRFCRLIPKIQSKEFLIELRVMAQSNNEDIRRRANFALEYVVDL